MRSTILEEKMNLQKTIETLTALELLEFDPLIKKHLRKSIDRIMHVMELISMRDTD